MTISDALENRILDAVFNNTSLAIASTYVKLHIGDPGEAGTSNAAAETTRQSASWAAASGGSIATDATLTWNTVAATEVYTYISVWDAATAGTCLWTGPLATSYAVNASDNFVLTSTTVIASLD